MIMLKIFLYIVGGTLLFAVWLFILCLVIGAFEVLFDRYTNWLVERWME